MNRSRQTGVALDEYLIASARLGDNKALSALVARWNGKLLAHAWRLLGDSDAARDAVQDAWAEIVRNIGSLKDTRAFPAWAYRIVSRRCARLIDATVKRRQFDRAALDQPAVPEDAGPKQADIDTLRAAIRTLPGDQRAALALFYFEDMSVAEVAVALDVPAGTVKTRLMHARKKLRVLLDGETR